jgi:hypothetical protein
MLRGRGARYSNTGPPHRSARYDGVALSSIYHVQRAPSANPPHIQTPPAWLRELHKRWSAAGLPLVAVACHPGVIPSSELARHIKLPRAVRGPFRVAFAPFFKVWMCLCVGGRVET